MKKQDGHYWSRENPTLSGAFYYTFVWINFRDPAIWLLIISNLVTIYYAIVQHWGVETILVVYWLQCMIIGFFNLLRMLRVKVDINDVMLTEIKLTPNPFATALAKFGWTTFFLIFYWMVLAYSVVLIFPSWDYSSIGKATLSSTFLPVLLFFINHLFSSVKNWQKDRDASITTLAVFPFLRVVPMMLVVFLMTLFSVNYAVLFLILKTFVDVKSYHWERLVYYKPTEEEKKKMLKSVERFS